MLVDVTRCDRHNEEPPTSGKVSGLFLTKRSLGQRWSEPMSKGTLRDASNCGQGGFAS